MVVGKGWDQSNQTSASIFPAPFSIQGRFLHSFSGVQLRSWSGSWHVAQLNGVGDAWFSTSNLLLASRSCECLYLRTDLYLGYFLRSFFFSVWRKISTSIVCSPVGVRWGSKRLFCWGGGLFFVFSMDEVTMNHIHESWAFLRLRQGSLEGSLNCSPHCRRRHCNSLGCFRKGSVEGSPNYSTFISQFPTRLTVVMNCIADISLSPVLSPKLPPKRINRTMHLKQNISWFHFHSHHFFSAPTNSKNKPSHNASPPTSNRLNFTPTGVFTRFLSKWGIFRSEFFASKPNQKVIEYWKDWKWWILLVSAYQLAASVPWGCASVSVDVKDGWFRDSWGCFQVRWFFLGTRNGGGDSWEKCSFSVLDIFVGEVQFFFEYQCFNE